MRYAVALAHYSQLLNDIDADASQPAPDHSAASTVDDQPRGFRRLVVRPRCDRMARSRDAARQRRLHHFAVCLRNARERSRQLQLVLDERHSESMRSAARDTAARDEATREEEWS